MPLTIGSSLLSKTSTASSHQGVVMNVKSSRITSILVLLAVLLGLMTTPVLGDGDSLKGTHRYCDQVGGIWQPYAPLESWRGACVVPWSKEKCGSERQAWYEKSSTCKIEENGQSILAECSESGGAWVRNSRDKEECVVPGVREACAAGGGIWFVGGPMNISRCLRHASDGGAACTSSSQCQLRCVAPWGQKNGEEAQGRCQEQESSGCGGNFVENGVVARVMCIS